MRYIPVTSKLKLHKRFRKTSTNFAEFEQEQDIAKIENIVIAPRGMSKEDVRTVRRSLDEVGRPAKELNPLFESNKEVMKVEQVAKESFKSHFVIPEYDDNEQGMKPKHDLDR